MDKLIRYENRLSYRPGPYVKRGDLLELPRKEMLVAGLWHDFLSIRCCRINEGFLRNTRMSSVQPAGIALFISLEKIEKRTLGRSTFIDIIAYCEQQ